MENMIKSAVLNKAGVPKFRTYLNLSAIKHRLTSGNIANVLTPGYKARSIDFEAEYRRAVDGGVRLSGVQTHSGHISIGGSRAEEFEIKESDAPASNGMSNVDIDKEITQMAINQMSYTIAARMVRDRFEGLRKAITGSR